MSSLSPFSFGSPLVPSPLTVSSAPNHLNGQAGVSYLMTHRQAIGPSRVVHALPRGQRHYRGQKVGREGGPALAAANHWSELQAPTFAPLGNPSEASATCLAPAPAEVSGDGNSSSSSGNRHHQMGSKKRNRAPAKRGAAAAPSSATSVSRDEASGEFDTPSAYLPMAREAAESGGLWKLWTRASGPGEDAEAAAAAEDDEDEAGRARKKRRSVAGALLSTAIDAAVFTGAIGYAAYQLWRGRGATPPDQELSAAMPSPPSPRAEQYSQQSAAKAAPAPRRAARVHISRPRPGISARAPPLRYSNKARRSVDKALEAVDGALAHGAMDWVYREASPAFPPNEALGHQADFLRGPSPSAADLSSLDTHRAGAGATMQAIEAETGDDSDPMMLDFQNRLQSLIASGQAALASQPAPDAEADSPSKSQSRLPASAFGSPSLTPLAVGGVVRSGTNDSIASSSPSASTSRTGPCTPDPTVALSARFVGHGRTWGARPPSGIPRPAGYGAGYRRAAGPGHVSGLRGVVKSEGVRSLEQALEATAHGTGKNWWEQ